MKMNRKGFTLVEIMIVVAIIALLAAIAIPNLLRAKVSANEALARSTLRTLSTASETFATANNGNYPLNEASLTGATPPYINEAYLTRTISGYTYDSLTIGVGGYSFTAHPASNSRSAGTSTFTISTGGILTAEALP